MFRFLFRAVHRSMLRDRRRFVPIGVSIFALLSALVFGGPVFGGSFFPFAEAGLAETGGGPQSAIRQVLEQQAAAWNRGDIDTFMQGYERSPRTAVIGKATVEYGYDRILAGYKRAYATPAAMGKLSFLNLDIRMLGPDYAVVTGNFHLQQSGKEGGTADGIFSLVFARRAAGWKIVLDHTSSSK